MSETLRDLVVSLSLNSDNFTRNIRSVNRQIQEAESRFALAGAGVAGFEKTANGLSAKLSTLQQKLSLQKNVVGQYERALAAADKKLEAAVAMQGKMQTALARAREKYRVLGQELKIAEARHSAWNTAVGEGDARAQNAKARLDALQKEFSETGQEIQKLEGQLIANEKYMQRCADAVSAGNTSLNNARAALKSTEAEITRANAALLTAQSRWTAAGGALASFSAMAATVSKTTKTIGTNLTRYLTTPIVALGAYSAKSAVDMEDAFAGVRKTVNMTEAEFADLDQAIRDMTLVKPSAYEDIAFVAETAGQLGVATGAIKTFTSVMTDLANVSTDLTAEDAATNLAKLANITGMEQTAENFERLGSTILQCGINSASTEGSIIEMAMRLAAAGKQVGLSEAQIVGFATALSSVGIEAQMGGTAFSKALIRMEVACETGGEALRDFAKVAGMSQKQFQALFESDPAQAFQAFIAGLAAMDDEGVSAIATLQDIGFSEVRLRDTTLRLVNANELLNSTQELAKKAWRDNAAITELVGKRYDTTAKRMQMLQNRARLAGETLGAVMIPTLEQLMETLSGALDGLMAMDEAQRTQIVNAALMAAALGPAISLFSKLSLAASAVTKGMGKFAAAVGKAGGGVKGFASVALSSKLAVAGLTAGIIAGTVALIDYASGARAAREALEGMEKTAAEWRAHSAETLYANDGLFAFGLDRESFVQSMQTAEQWRDGLLKVWSDGKIETDEIVSEWTDSFKALNAGARESLEELRESAASSGRDGLAESIRTDVDALDRMDAEIERLLKKRQSKNLTEGDKLRLDELLEQREEILVRYKLAPENGYEQILQGVQDEVNRALARGEKGAPVTAYAEGLTATAQGYAAVTDEIDRQYDAERALVDLMADGEEKQAEYAALDAQYNADRLAATRVYANTLKQLLNPVWESEGVQKANEGMDELFRLFREYSALGGEGYQNPEILEQMENLVAGLNEDDLISYLGLLQQVQSLLDGGMDAGEVADMFGADLTGGLDRLAALADFAKDRSGELSGLSEILSSLVPEEMQKIAVDLDMTAAEARWAEFAENPGSITTDAVIQSYADGEGVTVPKAVADALIESYSEIAGGADMASLNPTAKTAYVAAYMEQEGGADTANLRPADITAIVSAYEEIAENADTGALTPDELVARVSAYIEDELGADASGLAPSGILATVAAYEELAGGASTASLTPTGIAAYVTSYLQAAGYDTSSLTPSGVQAFVDSYAEAEEADKTGLLANFIAVVTGYDDSAATVPSPSATLAITGYDLAAYNAFVEEHPVEVRGVVRLGEQYENPEDVLDDPNAQFYLDGQQVAVDIVPRERITADTLFVYDEDGTMHVLVTPVVRGTPESVAEAAGALNAQSSFLGGALDGSVLEWLAIAEERLRHINEEGDTWKYGWDALVSSSLKGAIEPLQNVDVADWAAVQAFVQETIAALQNGEALDEGVLADLQTIANLLEMLEAFNLESNLTSAIGNAMEQAGWRMDGATVAANLQGVVDAAKQAGADAGAGIAEGMAGADLAPAASAVARNAEAALRAPGAFNSRSPARSTMPVGRDAALGVGAGMAGTDLSADANIVAGNIVTALASALNASALRPVGLNAMLGMATGIRAGQGSVVAAIRAVARAAVQAAKTTLQIRSPSKVFEDEVGRQMMRGLGEGVLRETEAQARAIRNAARYITGEAQAGALNTCAYDNRRTYNQQASATVRVERLYVRDEQDVRSLAIEIAQLTKRQQAALGAR